jgi:hypothetical protein
MSQLSRCGHDVFEGQYGAEKGGLGFKSVQDMGTLSKDGMQ